MTGILRERRWVWSAIGVLVFWLLLSTAISRFSLQNLSGVGASAAFLAIAGLGQMFVVASGGGNIDLSIASVITLSAFATVIISGGSDAALALALPAVVGIGATVGAVNAALVLAVRIPAMIATLAVGYVLATATLLANRVSASYGSAPLLLALSASKTFGVPTIILVAAAFVAAAIVLLSHTAFGRTLLAVGQNRRAAHLAGVRVAGVTTGAFIISGVLAAIDGALLSAHSGGAYLGMGAPYLLQSVGAVVVGGTLIFGGSATALGTFFGSVLLVLMVTTLQVLGLSGGAQDVVQGAAIVCVLAAAGGGAPRRER